jgi:hypothetical protein
MTDTLLKQNTGTKHIFYILGVLCVVCACVYGYFIQMTITRVVAREKAISVLSALRSQTANLENEYFALDGGVTVDRAKSLGFSEPLNIAYVERGVSSGLSLNQNAR